MEKHILKNDVKVFGFQVKSFPKGVGEAFDSLTKKIPGGFNRSYYGICEMRKNTMVYLATAEENNENEAKIYKCDRYTIEKGEYLTATLKAWRTKTDSIKDIFERLGQQPETDHTKPIVEWYKNEDEMMCMMKLKSAV
jgi:hypothetical protein